MCARTGEPKDALSGRCSAHIRRWLEFFTTARGKTTLCQLMRKISQQIVIPQGMEMPEESPQVAGRALHEDSSRATYDGRRTTKSKHRVLGEEASRRGGWTDLENLVVDVEITDWPSPTQNPRGRVIEILGREDDFGVDVEITIRSFICRIIFRQRCLRRRRMRRPVDSFVRTAPAARFSRSADCDHRRRNGARLR